MLKLIFIFFFSACVDANSHPLHTAWIDSHYPPENNFFMYSNYYWLKNNPIPADKGRWSIFDALNEKVNLEIKSLIKNLPQNPQLFSVKINQQLHQYFQSGLNSKLIEQEKNKALRPWITQINHYRHLNDLGYLIAKLHDIGVNVFFSVSPTSDIHQNQQFIAGIIQDGLNLPDRDYYFTHHRKNRILQTAYLHLLETFFIALNYSQLDAKKAAMDSFNIEKKLATFSKPKDFFRIPQNIDNPTTAWLFSKRYPNLFAKQYFIHRGLINDFKINNFSTDYFVQLNQYLQSLEPEKIRHYLLAHLFFTYANYMQSSVQKPFCQFEIQLSDSTTCQPRWKQMIDDLNELLGYAVGDLYLSQHYREGVIEKTSDMIDNIKNQMGLKIQNNSWLSTKTKHSALLKLSKMRSRIGYSDFKINYSTLGIKTQSYLANTIAMMRFETHRKFLQIGKPMNPKEWEMPPQSINAYYDVAKNEINIPYGILQEPFFNLDANEAINYGGIGAVIGHELSHGFDDQGAQFDEKGIFKKWWSPTDWRHYQQKVQCIVKQYSAFPVQGSKNHFLNGQLVSGEAIADLIGLNLAFEAFIQQKNQNIAKILQYDAKQQFFISYAHIWASHSRDAEALKRSRTDFHPPMEIRVNGTLKNVNAFYRAFHIKAPPQHELCQFF